MNHQLTPQNWKAIDDTIGALGHKSEEEGALIITGYTNAIADLCSMAEARKVADYMHAELGIEKTA